jgi:hypothetical protein
MVQESLRTSRGSVTTVRRLTILTAFLASANAVFVAILGSYDFRLGPVHLAAHGLFKPLLYLCAGVFVAALANCSLTVPDRMDTLLERLPSPWLIGAIIILLYLPSLGITIQNNDWTHQADARGWNSISDLAHLFVWKQPDGFYRPLVFVSLWADYRIFGDREWGYHLQNILFHIANCLLLMRLALRLGFDVATARWSGLLFAVAAANYEPVIWPGARFDLMATCFVLAALLFSVQWWRTQHTVSLLGLTVCLVAAVLSKESAYCFPLLAGLLFLTPEVWGLPCTSMKSRIAPLACAVGLSIALLLLRSAIFHGMGGYPDAPGITPQFAVRLSTFTSFFTRALPVPIFALNTTVAGNLILPAVVLVALGACGYAAFCGGTLRLKLGILVATLLTALPAANLVDWISPIMRNTRYLYMPSLWICLLLSLAATGKARKWLLLLALANVLATIHNYRSFASFDITRSSL